MPHRLFRSSAAAALAGALLAAPPAAADGPRRPPAYEPMRSFAPLVESVNDAVVSIEVEEEVTDSELSGVPPWFYEFFGVDPDGLGPRVLEGEGSGFIISEEGLLLTNHHVVAESRKLKVNFADGTFVNAVLLGSDQSLDVALLQLPQNRDWPYVEMGTSSDVKVGDWVVAVGNPLGLGHTVTAGIISGKGRPSEFSVWQQFMQTDAAINPGNSGGPLFDLDGRVIGINTAIVAGANTVGFSVPIDLVKAALDDLQTEGRVVRGFIGISSEPVSAEVAHALDLDDRQGARITAVQPNTPAAKAGLRVGDVVTALDGEPVGDDLSLIRWIAERRPGQTVSIEVRRGDETMKLKATLVDRDRWLAEPAGRATEPSRGL